MTTPYAKLRKLREEIVLLPGLRTYKDFDIAIEIGHYELLGTPLNQKQLILLNIASPATVRRHLNRLIRSGFVEKMPMKDDLRCASLMLTKQAHAVFDQCIARLKHLL